MNKTYVYIGIAVALILGGLILGWYLWRPAPPKAETYAAAQTQEDGSTVLERKPDAHAKPAHKVPKGAKVERVMRVTVAPEQVADAGKMVPAGVDTQAPISASVPDCPPVDVDLSLVRLPDDSRKVIASSPNGRIIGGVDIPVESAAPYKELKWAAGITANPIDRTFGGFLDRDLGPFRLGVEVNQINDGYDARLKAGVRF